MKCGAKWKLSQEVFRTQPGVTFRVGVSGNFLDEFSQPIINATLFKTELFVLTILFFFYCGKSDYLASYKNPSRHQLF